MRKFTAALAAVLMLGGCSAGVPEETEITAAENAEISEAETVATVTTAGTSETVIFCDENVFEETSAEIADTAADERSEFAKKAEENPAVNVDIIIDEKDIYNSAEMLVGYFYAEYPEISGADEAVCKKINEAVRSYVYGVLQEEQDNMYNRCIDEDGSIDNMFLFWLNDLDRKEIRSINCEINCNYGNLFSIYFDEFNYNMCIPCSYTDPHTMVFDLRTGEQVDFDEIIADREGFDSVFEKAFKNHGSYMKCDDWFDFDGEKYDYMLINNVSVKNDCLGMYLVEPPKIVGSSEVCEVCVPVGEIEEYLTEEGKALFEGYTSDC